MLCLTSHALLDEPQAALGAEIPALSLTELRPQKAFRMVVFVGTWGPAAAWVWQDIKRAAYSTLLEDVEAFTAPEPPPRGAARPPALA